MFNLKVINCIIFYLITNLITGQIKDDALFFIPEDQVKKFHTISDLEDLKKGDLIKIYQDRVREIVTVMPFLSLANEPNVRLSDIGIKEDSNHLKILKKNTEVTQEALLTIEESIEELVPYADTEKIIWAILYYEDVIKKMRIGFKGNL